MLAHPDANVPEKTLDVPWRGPCLAHPDEHVPENRLHVHWRGPSLAHPDEQITLVEAAGALERALSRSSGSTPMPPPVHRDHREGAYSGGAIGVAIGVEAPGGPHGGGHLDHREGQTEGEP